MGTYETQQAHYTYLVFNIFNVPEYVIEACKWYFPINDFYRYPLNIHKPPAAANTIRGAM